MRRIFGGFLLVLMATGAICAQTQKPESKTIVLKAARLFDGKSATLVTPGMVVVTDGKIVAAGTTADAPAGAQVIDLGDATLLPGFIDAHTHVTMMYTTDYKQAMLDGLQKSVPEQTLDAVENARVTLMAGFTTVRDVGSRHFIDVGLRNAIRNGKVPGPRMLVSVHAIGATGGHCDETGFRSGVFGKETGPEEGVANGPDEVRYAVRLAHKYGADVIKTCASGGVLSLADDVDTPQLTQDEMNALIDEAHALKRKVAAHAHGPEAARRAIRAGVDSIEHGTFLDDEAMDMMKQHGTYLVPTLEVRECVGANYPQEFVAKANQIMTAQLKNFRKAVDAGVKIAFGTDIGVCPFGQNAREFNYMVQNGMTPMSAIQSATVSDANLLGISDKVGSIARGKLADIIAVQGDPLTDIRLLEDVRFVMKQGEIFKQD